MRQSIRKRPEKGLVKTMTALALALAMVIASLPEGLIRVKANDPTSGTCGATESDNVTWALSLNGEKVTIDENEENAYTLTIGGTGEMANYFDSSNQPWYSYSNRITRVEIGSGITKTGREAFESLGNLKRVHISGNNLICIGPYCFERCNRLEEINLNEGLIRIAQGAFADCSGLSTFSIPKNVSDIDWIEMGYGQGAFQGCSGLTNFNIDPDNTTYSYENGLIYNKDKTELIYCVISFDSPVIATSVTKIDKSAFEYKGIKSIVIPENVTTIEKNAFYSCLSLESVEILGNLNEIPEKMFCYCRALKTVTLPSNITSIGEKAFYYTHIVNITIPENVSEIGDNAFNCMSLNMVSIPVSVTTIGKNVFTSSLKSIYYAGTEAQWNAITIDDTTKTKIENVPKIFGAMGPVNVADPTIILNQENYYTGLAIEPAVTVKNGETVIDPSEYTVTYSNNIEIGINTGKVTITDNVGGRYTISEKTATFSISAPTVVNDPTIVFDKEFYDYTGSEVEPTVTVKYGETVIPSDEYTVTFSNNIQPGTATATITDKSGGKYTVNGTATFDIFKVVTSPFIELQSSLDYTYDGTEKTPDIEVWTDSAKSKRIDSSEYTVTYSDNINAGTATVKVTDKEGGVYKVNGSTTFTIEKKDITPSATITDSKEGNNINTPVITGNDGNGEITVEYSVYGADSFSATVPTERGRYIARITIAETANYKSAVTETDFNILRSASGSGTEADPWDIGETSGDTVKAYLTGTGENLTLHFTGNGETWHGFGDINCPWTDKCSSIKDVVFDEGSAVTYLGAYIFKSTAIESIDIPDSVGVINSAAISNCLDLKYVTIGKGLTYLNSAILSGSNNIESIIINGNGNLGINSGALNGFTKLTTLKLNGVKEISSGAFCGCNSLNNVVIPKDINVIAAGSFGGCSSLSKVILLSKYTDDISISGHPFDNCSVDLKIYVPIASLVEYKAVDWGIGNTDNVIGYAAVAVSDGVVNGKVSVSEGSLDADEVKFYLVGEEVTITATADEGYELESISVKDASGKAVTVTDNKFTVPAGNVTVSATFKEIPKPVVLSSITISTAPTKIIYTEGEKFDATGMVVTATYSNGTSTAVTGYTWTPNGNLATSDNAVTVSYTEDGVTKTATQAITVNANNANNESGNGTNNESGNGTNNESGNGTNNESGNGTNNESGNESNNESNNGSGTNTNNGNAGENEESNTNTDNEDPETGNGSGQTQDDEPSQDDPSNNNGEPESDIMVGDIDGDGKVTPKDVTKLRRYLAGGWDVEVSLENADIDGDGKVTPKDVTILRRYLAGGWGIELPKKAN